MLFENVCLICFNHFAKNSSIKSLRRKDSQIVKEYEKNEMLKKREQKKEDALLRQTITINTVVKTKLEINKIVPLAINVPEVTVSIERTVISSNWSEKWWEIATNLVQLFYWERGKRIKIWISIQITSIIILLDEH